MSDVFSLYLYGGSVLSDTTTQRVTPEVGEIVIATVVKVTDYGAYAALDEYDGMEGFIHISEVASTWVRNIRNFVRENQKVVLKVLRVDPVKHHVDLSLRRVSGTERKSKLVEWKRRRKAAAILKSAAEELKIEAETFVRDVMAKLEDKYGDAYEGLEDLAERGEEAANRLKLPQNWATAVLETVKQKVRIPTVTIKGSLELTCPKPDGVGIIKKILMECKSAKRHRKARVNIYTVGAPRYAVEVTAKDYKDAEKVMAEISEYAVREIEKSGGDGYFKRES
ncbi:MAG: translation initiation factor IF-2 subunit alpha [Candidatus Bathyarchaeia archaeon]